MIIIKNDVIEIFDPKEKITTFLPNEINCDGNEINMNDLILEIQTMSSNKSKNLLLTDLRHVNDDLSQKPGYDFKTIWDIKNKKEIITFDERGSYLVKEGFKTFILSPSGKYAAVLFDEPKKISILGFDIFNARNCYFDVWDLDSKKIISTFHVPLKSSLVFTWGDTDDTIIVSGKVWSMMEYEKILIYHWQKHIHQ